MAMEVEFQVSRVVHHLSHALLFKRCEVSLIHLYRAFSKAPFDKINAIGGETPKK